MKLHWLNTGSLSLANSIFNKKKQSSHKPAHFLPLKDPCIDSENIIAQQISLSNNAKYLQKSTLLPDIILEIQTDVLQTVPDTDIVYRLHDKTPLKIIYVTALRIRKTVNPHSNKTNL
jgi:hypothetical protein